MWSRRGQGHAMKSVFWARPDPEVVRGRMAGWRGWLWVWLPVVIGVLVIVCESTNTFSAENTSAWIRPWMERIFGHINDTVWYLGHHIARKSGHLTGYGILCLMWLRGWLLTLAVRPGFRHWRLRATGLAIAGTFFVASMDEWHQTFIPSRTGLFSDVLIDTFGGTVACTIVALIFWRRAVRGRRLAVGDQL